MERERNRAVACTMLRCQALHLSVLDVYALPQGHHGCLKYPGIRKQPEQGDEFGVFVLCCHLVRHYVDLVGSLDGGQAGEPAEALPKRCVPPDDLNKARQSFECRIRVGLHVQPVSEQYVWDKVIGAKTKSGNPLFRITVAVALPTALVQGQSRPESPLLSAAPHRQPPSVVDHLSCLTADAIHRSNPNEELGSRQRQTS